MATNNQLPNCPPLRFPEFNDEWKRTTLGEIAELVTRKNDNSGKHPVMMISSEQGFIHQIEKYSNDNYGSSLSKYTLLVKGELSYNRGASKRKKYGSIFTLQEDSALVPYVYHSFRFNSSLHCPYFWGYYLNSDQITPILGKLVSSSARMDGLLNISKADFFGLPIPLPSLAEQQKIAAFLSLLDERIEAQRQTIEEQKKQKKALLQQIFSQSLRFPECEDKWKETTLGEVCTIKTGKLDANAMTEDGSYPFFTCAKQTYHTDTYSFSGEAILIAGNGEVGLTKYYNGKFNAYQRTYVLQSFCRDIILLFIRNHVDYVLPKRIFSFLNGSAMPYITLSTLSDMPLSLPSLEEQKKIAKLFTIFDERIEVEEALLACYEMQKRYLLRQMFV